MNGGSKTTTRSVACSIRVVKKEVVAVVPLGMLSHLSLHYLLSSGLCQQLRRFV